MLDTDSSFTLKPLNSNIFPHENKSDLSRENLFYWWDLNESHFEDFFSIFTFLPSLGSTDRFSYFISAACKTIQLRTRHWEASRRRRGSVSTIFCWSPLRKHSSAGGGLRCYRHSSTCADEVRCYKIRGGRRLDFSTTVSRQPGEPDLSESSPFELHVVPLNSTQTLILTTPVWEMNWVVLQLY